MSIEEVVKPVLCSSATSLQFIKFGPSLIYYRLAWSQIIKAQTPGPPFQFYN